MATTMMKKMVIFVGLLLGVCSTVGADTDSLEKCKNNFPFPQHVDLCHKANLKTADQCKEGQGFVLDELVIAPKSEYKEDCGNFHNNDLLDTNCLQDKIVNYDERVFEVLEKVSGQNKIDNGTTVQRFEFNVMGSDTEGGGTAGKDTSAFVSFRKQCRPADPDNKKDTVVNMCANMTVEGFRVYLTLQGTADIPSQTSFCRCVITPNAEMDVKALDVRLQNVKDNGQRCGPSGLKIESKEPPDSGSRDLKCEGKKALYGFHQLQKGSKDKEVVLTLTSVDTSHFPTAVWIEVEQKYDQNAAHSPMTVACEGFVSMSELVVPVPTTDPGKREDGPKDEGVPLGPIIGAAVGGLLLIAIIIIILVKRRRSGSYSGVLPLACTDCCKRDSKGKKPYKQVVQSEPIYSEPGNPRPAPYTDPIDAKLPVGRAEYAEPDPSGRPAHATTPPPLPTSPPPTSPPPGVTPTGTSFPFPTQPQDAVPSVAFSTDEEAPPKPMRTFERAKKRSKKSEAEEEEEYDHIVSNDKPSLKSLRNGQNNNVIAKNDKDKEPNLYSHLSHGENYNLMELKAKLKPVVKDNVYDTTS